MVKIDLDKKLSNHLESSKLLQQTSFWAAVKQKHGLHTLAFNTNTLLPDTNGNNHPKERIIHRDLLILLQPLGNGATMAYVPYGPKYQPDEENRGLFLESLSESLKPYLPASCLFIRYDLPWKSPWIDDDNRYDDRGNWLGTPEPRIREMRMNMDTHYWQLRKAPTNVLPSNTVFIDLEQSDDILLARMKSKTRYNIRLAQRKGVKISKAGMDELPVWYDLYQQTTQRNGLTHDEMSYFQSVLKLQHHHQTPNTKVFLLMAKMNEIPLAGLFLTISGGRASYLYGASSNENRQYMGTYALQWEAMKIARQEGCKEYDLFGISEIPDPNHPMYGLYRFKTGFGGEIFHRQGCWDYPMDEKKYEHFRSAELNAVGYHQK
ncbi:MAG: peptidoglycan bridge formation glycyltransferase FemA/FemB family protein [Bacteroidetes bacterium]|jgi:lipid II:glycine glycyltransferase (peptidoglycan interpeptide bridge formation enzyme)|nr:peptidoglycan bridge formation glycyltransferase FemA/FemB family protein [Bacteroidota bacterium]